MTKRKQHSTSFQEIKEMALADPEVRAAYDEAERAWKLKEILIEAREHANLTQAELARKLDLAPSNLNRLEKNPAKANIQTLFKYLDACNAKIDFSLNYI